MVRKDTKLYKLQQMIFHDAFEAEKYYDAVKHDGNTYVQDMARESKAVINEMLYLISMMGWDVAYSQYCENEKSRNEPAPSSN